MIRLFCSVMLKLQMRPDKRSERLSLVQRILEMALSPRRGNISPVTGFTGLDPTLPISTFLGLSNSRSVTLSELQRKRTLDIAALQEKVKRLHPVVSESFQKNGGCTPKLQSRVKLPNFTEGDIVLVAGEEFSVGKTLCL